MAELAPVGLDAGPIKLDQFIAHSISVRLVAITSTTMDIDANINALKRFLFLLPQQQNYTMSAKARKAIRKCIFLTISNHGKYLDWVFPNAFDGQDSAKVLEKIERDFDWLLANYYKQNHNRDPKFNTHNHHAFHSNVPCSRIFRTGEPIYRCLSCGYDDTCALCSHCFVPENHEGHKVHITISLRENGGVCDCGDPEAWVKEFNCPYATTDDMDIRNRKMPNDLQQAYLRTIETLLDYVIDVMSHSDLQFVPANELNKELIEYYSMNSMLDPAKYGFESGAEPTDVNSEAYYLMVYNDQIRHYRDAVQRIRLASRKVMQFAVMVTNKAQSYGKAIVLGSKDISFLKERQKILGATGLATCIRSQRDIFREDMCDEILLWISDLTESELFKINNNARSLFCRAFCGRWDNGLLLAPKIHSLLVYNTGRLDFHNKIPKVPSNKNPSERNTASAHWTFEPSKWDLPQEICDECNYNLDSADYNIQASHLGSRFQYLIYLDIRFWGSIRATLHDMYSTSLITDLHYKNIISSQYVDVYPAIADMFLTMDREPELNLVATLSTQLLTCPSNSTSIIKHNDLSRIFASIYGFFTVEEIKSPQNLEVCHQVSMKSLKNRKWGQIFFDIGYILTRSRDSKSIFVGSVIPMACDILALFHGRPVLRRESKNHVEYESPDYTAFFHAIAVIYQFGENIAQCFSNLKNSNKEEVHQVAKNVISYVYTFLLKFENSDYPGLSDETVDIEIFKDRKFITEPIEGTEIQDFRIDRDKVSFLHPIHSFLSWLIQLADFDTIEQVGEILSSTCKLYASKNTHKLSPTTLYEYSLRTVVLASQIKSGFWVRNGFSVRSQLQLYKSTSLRESGYMRDIFMIQLFANLNTPNLVSFTIFNRWLLLDDWVSETDVVPNKKEVENASGLTAIENNDLGDLDDDSAQLQQVKDLQISDDSSTYDPKVLPYMVEECTNFLIHLLTEDLYLRGLSSQVITETRIQNEIIHNLCFGQMSYTKLCSFIPDHIVGEKRFDIILDELTVFTSPNGSKDVGSYRLKDEFFRRINPYYFNYSANTKDDAVKLVKENLRKRKGMTEHQVVITPQLRPAGELGIYKYVGNFSVSVYFNEFMIKSLLYVIDMGIEKVDSMLETTLHLLHICAFENTLNKERYGSFFDRIMTPSEKFKVSIGKLLYSLLADDSFKSHHAKVRAIFDVFCQSSYDVSSALDSQISGFDSNKLHTEADNELQENDIDRKKRIAKEKQNKLLAKFKKQQSAFMKKNGVNTLETSDTEMSEYEDEPGWQFPETHCMLCQNTSEDAGPFGIITYVSRSSEFRSVPFGDKYWFMKSFSDSASLDEDEREDNGNVYSENWKTFMKKIKDDNVVGPGFSHQEHVDSKLVSSSCGHGMHFQCYLNYFNNSNRQNQITRNTPDNMEHKEFLCPLCKAINNMFIPILWTSNCRSLKEFLAPGPLDSGILSTFDFKKYFEKNKKEWFATFVEKASKDIEAMSNLNNSSKDMIRQSFSPETTSDRKYFAMVLANMSQVLSLFYFPKVYKPGSVEILSNTIKSTEISLRGVSSSGTLVINQLSHSTLINLRSMNEFRFTILLMYCENWMRDPLERFEPFIQILANILAFSNDTFNQKVLEQDFFDLLVATIPLPSTGFSFNVLLKACFMGHVIQSLFFVVNQIINHDFYQCSDYSILDIPFVSTIDEEKAKLAKDLFVKVREFIAPSSSSHSMIVEDPVFGHIIYSMLMKAVTPFLRRSAIYSFVVCANTDNIIDAGYSDLFLEADKLCSLMNLDNLSELLQRFIPNDNSSFENKKFNGFLQYYREYGRYNDIVDYRVQMEYPGIIKLADLPERLDFFFTKYYYSDKYNNPRMSIDEPAICLYCGEVVDTQRCAIGSDKGQCTTHMMKECPNNVGIFLLPKEKSILLLHKNGGSFINAPFLDKHGELPSEGKRSKTLYLMQPRYDDFIKNIWLHHNIPNYIARKLDSVIDSGGWDTL